MPILEPTKSGGNHHCITCHHAYSRLEGVNSVSEVERIIASLENRRMPIRGDQVKPAYIEKFKVWRFTGFKIGTLGSVSSLGSNAGSN